MEWSILIPLATAVVRGVLGWCENALKDNKVSKFELRQLLSTIVRISVVGFSAAYGFGIDETQAAALAVLMDIIFVKVDKAIKADKKPAV